MGKSSLIAVAAAGTGACFLGSSAFTVGQQVAGRPAAPQQFLGQSAVQAPQGQSGSSLCAAVGAVVGVAAGVAAVNRSRVPRKGAFDIKVAEDAEFAGGLIGAKHAGFGEYEWDPAGFSTRYPEHLAWYREAELKHGRVAMLAFVGLIVPDFVRLPLPVFDDPSLDMLTAHNALIGPGLGEGPMWVLLCFCGAVESLRFKQLGLGFENLTLENAGDCNFGKAFLPKTEEGIELMKTKELKNGRLAMMAVSGIFTAGITWDAHHFPWLPGQAVRGNRVAMAAVTTTDSEGRDRFVVEGGEAAPAPAKSVAVTTGGAFAGGLIGSKFAGLGEYQWDPAGFTENYPEHLAWYREAELKHGRVAMLAFVGLVAPDLFRIPLDVFEDPALDMVSAHNRLIGPGLGEGPMWWLLTACAIVESLRFKDLGLGFEKLTLENAGDCNFGKGFLPKTAEGIELMKTKELKNGRLAMLAVSGIFTAGVTWDCHHFPWVP